MRLYLGGAAVAAAVGVFAFAQAAKAPAAPAAPTRTVQIKMFKFSPRKLVVKAGTRVTWVNRDGDPHTVTSTKGRALHSQALDTGKRYSVVLRKPGTYNYICKIHPFMHGVVVVRR
jgi:plastocyanin